MKKKCLAVLLTCVVSLLLTACAQIDSTFSNDNSFAVRYKLPSKSSKVVSQDLRRIPMFTLSEFEEKLNIKLNFIDPSQNIQFSARTIWDGNEPLPENVKLEAIKTIVLLSPTEDFGVIINR